jgi:hypothetical protein
MRHQPLYIFYFFKFQLEFLSVFKVLTHSIQKIPSILLLLRQSVVCMRKLLSFSTNPSPKNSGTIHFMFGGRFGVFQTGVEYGLRSTMEGGIFHQIKVRQRIGRKNSSQAACRRMRRLEAFFYFAAQNFKFFSKAQNHNLKI